MIRTPPIRTRRLAVNDSYTFLMKELEKVDDAILEPLSGTDWPRDMPVITGGGLLESIASVDVTYASSGGMTTTSSSRRPTISRSSRRTCPSRWPGPSISPNTCPSPPWSGRR